MAERPTVSSLAKELGLRPQEIYKQLLELKINVRRMGAHLTHPQAEKIRLYNTNKRAALVREQRRSEHLLKPPSPPPTAEPELHNFTKTCQCCDRRWTHRSPADSLEPLCPACKHHYEVPAEPMQRTLDREKAHAQLYKADRDLAYKATAASYKEKERAYISRSKWRNALVETVLDHDELDDGSGNCWCGHPYPCRTWRRLAEANTGIHRQVEKWASWTPQRLEKFLWDDDRLLIDEDQINAAQGPAQPLLDDEDLSEPLARAPLGSTDQANSKPARLVVYAANLVAFILTTPTAAGL